MTVFKGLSFFSCSHVEVLKRENTSEKAPEKQEEVVKTEVTQDDLPDFNNVPEEDYMELATLDGCVNYLEPKMKDL